VEIVEELDALDEDSRKTSVALKKILAGIGL
jgi:hypothetical protein